MFILSPFLESLGISSSCHVGHAPSLTPPPWPGFVLCVAFNLFVYFTVRKGQSWPHFVSHSRWAFPPMCVCVSGGGGEGEGVLGGRGSRNFVYVPFWHSLKVRPATETLKRLSTGAVIIFMGPLERSGFDLRLPQRKWRHCCPNLTNDNNTWSEIRKLKSKTVTWKKIWGNYFCRRGLTFHKCQAIKLT